MSRAWPFRPNGWNLLNDASCSGLMRQSKSGVSTTAGAMAFTRILYGANSMARLPVSAWTPPFAVEDALQGVAAMACMAHIDPVFTMAPEPRVFIEGMTACAAKK